MYIRDATEARTVLISGCSPRISKFRVSHTESKCDPHSSFKINSQKSNVHIKINVHFKFYSKHFQLFEVAIGVD